MTQPAFSFGHEATSPAWKQLHHAISDRGSKYSVTIGKVSNREELNAFLKELKRDKAYRKATHNTFAARLSHDGSIHEVKRDDGETGAGMIILRSLRKHDMVNTIMVVTRWYGGVHLNADRFKHVQDSCDLMLQAIGVLQSEAE